MADTASAPPASTATCPDNLAESGRAAQCKGCPGQAACLAGADAGPDPDQKLVNVRMGAIRHKLVVVSGKGGVGKSSVAALLSTVMALDGKQVGLLDLDICGPSQPELMGFKGQQVVDSDYGWIPLKSPEGVKCMSVGSLLASDRDAVIFRGPRKTAMIKRFLKDTFWGRLHALVIDTPPGTSDEHLTVLKLLKDAKPDGAVIVTTPQEVALGTIRKEIQFCQKMGLPIIGLVENMSGFACPCCGDVYDLWPRAAIDELAQANGLRILGRIPVDPRLGEACERGRVADCARPPPSATETAGSSPSPPVASTESAAAGSSSDTAEAADTKPAAAPSSTLAWVRSLAAAIEEALASK